MSWATGQVTERRSQNQRKLTWNCGQAFPCVVRKRRSSFCCRHTWARLVHKGRRQEQPPKATMSQKRKCDSMSHWVRRVRVCLSKSQREHRHWSIPGAATFPETYGPNFTGEMGGDGTRKVRIKRDSQRLRWNNIPSGVYFVPDSTH